MQTSYKGMHFKETQDITHEDIHWIEEKLNFAETANLVQGKTIISQGVNLNLF